MELLVKAKFFSENCNLSNLVVIKRLHENDKRIICVSDGFYTLFKKAFLLFHAALLNCFIYRGVGILDFTWRKNPPFLSILLLRTLKKCNHKKNHTYLNLVYSIYQAVDIYKFVKLLTSSFCHYF